MGITTVVENIDEIATSINWPAQCIVKWLGVDLKCMATYAEMGDRRAVLAGGQRRATVQASVDRFTQKYFTCNECRHPSLGKSVTHDQRIDGSCGACGWAGPLDGDARLTAFF